MPERIETLESGCCGPELYRDESFCELCRVVLSAIEMRLEPQAQGHEEVRKHTCFWWHDLTSLRYCARMGCKICAFAVKNASSQYLDEMATWTSNTFGLQLNLWPDKYEGVLAILPPAQSQKQTWNASPDVWHVFDDRRRFWLNFVAIKENENVDSFRTGPSTGSSETFERISQWLDSCKSHEHCNQWHNIAGHRSKDSPTRLLQIESKIPVPFIKLIEASDMPAAPAYATLSHCWGSAPLGQLSRENMQAHCSGIAWEGLARTFQEAILAVAKLNIRFIWIDALCIVQNDEADWHREASRMAIVYANSTLNISADASSDGNGGLFRHRDPIADGFFMVTTTSHSAALRAISFYQDGWSEEVQYSPLAERAWVIQEHFLAPRVVHFGAHQVYWECAQTTQLEALPTWRPYVPSNTYALQKCKILDDRADNFAHGERYASWCRLLIAYSQAKLTISSDRTMAFAGLVSAYVSLFGWQPSDYIFGLWKPELVHFLAWCRRGFDHLSHPVDGNFPSWSWLCLKEAIGMEGGSWTSSMESVSDVLDIFIPAVHPSNESDSQSMILIRGPLCQSTVCQAEEPFLDDRWDLEGRRMLKMGSTSLRQNEHFYLNLDEVSEANLENTWSAEVFLLLLRSEVIEYPARPDLYHEAPEDEVSHAIKFEQNPCLDGWHQPKYHDGRYQCLILQPVAEPGHFRRIGFLRVHGAVMLASDNTMTHEKSFANMLFACQTLDRQFQSPDIPPELYHEVDENFMYTITLV